MIHRLLPDWMPQYRLKPNPMRRPQPAFGIVMHNHIVDSLELGLRPSNSTPLQVLQLKKQPPKPRARKDSTTTKHWPLTCQNTGQPLEQWGFKIIRWPEFVVAPKQTPIQTRGMSSCIALNIQGSNHAHYLAHINPWTSISHLVNHLKRDIPINLLHHKTRIQIVPGMAEDTVDTVEDILEALAKVSAQLPKRVKYRHYPEQAKQYGDLHRLDSPVSVVSVAGDLFMLPSQARLPHFKDGGKVIDPREKSVQY